MRNNYIYILAFIAVFGAVADNICDDGSGCALLGDPCADGSDCLPIVTSEEPNNLYPGVWRKTGV